MRLTERQKKLVAKNVPLVNVHIRRFVDVPPDPTSCREYDDLFQEGCLALMRAAKRYDAIKHGPFAAYAIPHVHRAVSNALMMGFATVRVPSNAVYKARKRKRKAVGADRHRPEPALARTLHLTNAAIEDLAAKQIHHQPASNSRLLGRPWRPERPTIGDRLRAKYEAAVYIARRRTHDARRKRDDRDALMRRIVNERLLIPDSAARTTIRRLARDFRCSTARVVHGEWVLMREVRSLMEADDEVRLLLKAARHESDGMGAVLDESTASMTARAAREGFARRFARAPADRQAVILRELARKTTGSLSGFAARLFGHVDARSQCELLGGVRTAGSKAERNLAGRLDPVDTTEPGCVSPVNNRCDRPGRRSEPHHGGAAVPPASARPKAVHGFTGPVDTTEPGGVSAVNSGSNRSGCRSEPDRPRSGQPGRGRPGSDNMPLTPDRRCVPP